MATALIILIRFIQQALFLILLLYAVLSWVASPYHPVRMALARFIEPLLRPIQRLLPPIRGIDLSPLILIVLVYFFGSLLIYLLS